MKRWVSLLILIALGFGVYHRYVTFDPLSLLIIVVLMWNNLVLMGHNQQLANLIQQSSRLIVDNQKAIFTKIDNVRADLRRIIK